MGRDDQARWRGGVILPWSKAIAVCVCESCNKAKPLMLYRSPLPGPVSLYHYERNRSAQTFARALCEGCGQNLPRWFA